MSEFDDGLDDDYTSTNTNVFFKPITSPIVAKKSFAEIAAGIPRTCYFFYATQFIDQENFLRIIPREMQIGYVRSTVKIPSFSGHVQTVEQLFFVDMSLRCLSQIQLEPIILSKFDRIAQSEVLSDADMLIQIQQIMKEYKARIYLRIWIGGSGSSTSGLLYQMISAITQELAGVLHQTTHVQGLSLLKDKLSELTRSGQEKSTELFNSIREITAIAHQHAVGDYESNAVASNRQVAAVFALQLCRELILAIQQPFCKEDLLEGRTFRAEIERCSFSPREYSPSTSTSSSSTSRPSLFLEEILPYTRYKKDADSRDPKEEHAPVSSNSNSISPFVIGCFCASIVTFFTLLFDKKGQKETIFRACLVFGIAYTAAESVADSAPDRSLIV